LAAGRPARAVRERDHDAIARRRHRHAILAGPAARAGLRRVDERSDRDDHAASIAAISAAGHLRGIANSDASSGRSNATCEIVLRPVAPSLWNSTAWLITRPCTSRK